MLAQAPTRCSHYMAGKQTKEIEPREYRYTQQAQVLKPLPSRALPKQSCVREMKVKHAR